VKNGQNRTRSRAGLIAALDVGSTKISCFIARVEAGGKLRVVGIGQRVSGGVRCGMIVDMEAAQAAVSQAVAAAEDMAGETVSEVVASYAGGRLHSATVGSEIEIAGHEVSEGDLKRALDLSAPPINGDSRIIHSIPINFTIDGVPNIRDPRGMYGEKLGVNMHLVSAPTGPLKNLATCIGRAHLDVERFVAAPYAAGLACLVEDEMDLGATCIDMGGGTTSIALFLGGRAIYIDSVPMGGAHVTSDIARGLSTPLAHAERLKTLHAHAIAVPADSKDIIAVPQVGEETSQEPNQVPKSILTGIVQPRLEEIFEHVRSRIEDSGLDKIVGRRIVLCGGASQLQGTRELAALVLDKQVRIGRPIRVVGLADATGGPAFAACAGLLLQAADQSLDPILAARGEATGRSGLFGRFGLWLRENF
jgi:cell division protein FtsA